MTSESKKPGRRRRILMWVIFLALMLFVGVRTAVVLHTRSEIVAAVRGAASIRLEEYTRRQRILTSRVLTKTDFSQVINALPLTGDYGIPGVIARCYIPHHRIVITDAETQRDTTLDVCFGCNQVRLPGSGILSMPALWRRPLRELFRQHGVPIRAHYPSSLDEEAP